MLPRREEWNVAEFHPSVIVWRGRDARTAFSEGERRPRVELRRRLRPLSSAVEVRENAGLTRLQLRR